jgi:TolB-like protein
MSTPTARAPRLAAPIGIRPSPQPRSYSTAPSPTPAKSSALLGEPARDPLTRTPSGEFPGTTPRGRGTRWLVGAAAAALVALGATTLWTRSVHAPAAGDTDAAGPVAAEAGALSMSDASVAVLPLSVRGTSAEDRYLGEGLTEEIIAQLAQVPGLKVISRTSVVALRDARLTTPQIAETLGVRHVLEGSLQRVGRMVQTRVQLVDARTDATIWQHEYESPDSNLFQLQDTVARQVATALVARVTGGRRDSGGVAAAMTSAVTSMGGRAGTNRPAAYQAYLRGHYWFDRRTPEALASAVAAFGEATRLDSGYADAWAGLAAAHTSRVIYGYPGREDPYTELARGLLLAERAVALDSASPHAWHALGDAHFTGGWPDSLVRRDMLRSVRAQTPGHEGSMALAFVVGREGRADSAVAMARRALARDPLSQAAQHSLLVLAIQGRRHDVARAQAARLVRASPKDPVTLMLASYAALFGGDARWCAEHAPPGAAVRASCLHALGRRAEAAAVADSITRQLESEEYQLIHQFLDLAGYHASTGDAAGAVRWLERSAAHSPVLQRWLLDAELFDPVRQSPVFREGLARVEQGIRERIQARAAMLARADLTPDAGDAGVGASGGGSRR